ncbi:hypothetical protein JF536_11570 [Priestia flexa]|uniref:hypothetical protein n=1 Tax=Priestia flexa TaxID=86664 RepID=UPI001A8C0D0A|nr:hypothetical protein [Priestia flexa]MBN8434735.1 hypothetical protein [Priestia flexa]MCA0967272.1 hypothetical protein [Priestia flexa]
MLEQKSLYVANFNCTFGTDNRPMLEYFEEVILPAFKSSEKRESDGNRYFFENVQLIMVKGQFMLSGLLIKSTKLEVKSRYTQENGLVMTNEVYPSDPYSYFLINLKNHRMVIVKNQKGSPNLSNFSATAKFLLTQYVRKFNQTVDQKEKKLPMANLNVVAIPFEGAIRKELRNVKKIKNIILRFYPLNGDVEDKETFTHLREMLDELDSKSGFAQINTPDNKDKVIDLLDNTKGLVRPSLRVVYSNKSSKTLKDDAFTEEMKIPLDDSESLYDNMDNIAGKVINKEEFNDTSEENQSIYDRFFGVLTSIFNR